MNSQHPETLRLSSDLRAALQRRVLRALHALGVRGVEPSLTSLLAIVPDPAAAVCATLLSLDEAGYIDGDCLRLTLLGFAAVKAPRAVAFERRRQGSLRKAIRVA